MTWPFSDHLFTNSALPGTPAVDLSSFADFLRRQAPELLPASFSGGGQPGGAGAQLPHGTTIVALKFPHPDLRTAPAFSFGRLRAIHTNDTFYA